MLDGFLQIELTDAVQILILYLCIYGVLRYVRGTRSAQVLMGVGILVLVFLGFTKLFHFDVLSRVIYYVLGGFALSMVIIFQHEIRRALALMGGQALFVRNRGSLQQLHVPEVLCQSILYLSEKRIGALIAIERGISLAGYEEAGIPLHALMSRELCISIFTPPQPLHDGGCIIRAGRIAAARCLFPISSQPDLICGTRHRAAVGLSEETDAVIFAVSEETGTVSVAYNGKLNRYEIDVQRKVLRWLRFAMPDQRPGHATFSAWLKSGLIRQWNQFAHHANKRRHEHADH
jgi:diadenylate cyclase